MENLGALAILLAFCLSVYAILGSLIGKWKRNPFLMLSAERRVYAVWALITLASGVLVYALMTSDFRLAYVAQHTNRAMPAVYKFAAWWGGQEGSLLFWSWLLSTYSAVVVFTNRRKLPRHDALRDRGPDGDAGLLPDPERLRAEPLPGADAWQGHRRCRRRQRPEPAAAVPGDGHPPADALPGLRRLRRCRSLSPSAR